MSNAAAPAGTKLGVDVGLARVGLAGSDPGGILATPIRTLKRDAKKNSDIRVLVREATERSAVQVFVGLPRTMKGGESASTRMAREYADLLAQALADAGLAVPVNLIDERLTTVSAHRTLHSAGMSSREHRKVVDQVAAVEILQQALDMQRALGRDVGSPVAVPDSVRRGAAALEEETKIPHVHDSDGESRR
ncbi:Holliday junction resolvase RuvX [Arthrobacter crystallopoietes]|uniref:Putative pre-16S rRNA nuclease n=1 Tax=Crystallibacter crystallopoietes TaxID=37928 RepID=A0A1H1GFA3_9MICC|nr:Holliday junction resolvase RuvX [Arthrobacter crystallopoietes]AUI52606.1 Holliday junction DNA helicase RuvA [Arthrobacter crystallopoietes]SDR11763.1 putative holliday junction resolvase [Arthrobacter crystallopoietes]